MDKDYISINRTPLKYIPVMILAALAINLLSLALPLTMKQIYSRIIVSKSIETLIVLIGACFVALVLESVLRYIKDISSRWIAAKHENRLSLYLTKKVLNSDDSHLEGANYGDKLERFNSISRLTAFSSTSFYQLFIDLPFSLIFLYLIYYMGGYLVIVPVAISGIYILIVIANSILYFHNREREIAANNMLLSQLSETLEKIHLIKAAGLEEFQIKRYKRNALVNSTITGYKSNNLLMIPETISAYFSQLNLFSIIIAGGYLMLNGGISFGEITACALLGGRAFSPIQSIMALYLQKKDIKLLKNRITEIALLPDRYPQGTPVFPDDIDGTLEIINLKYNDIQTKQLDIFSSYIPARSFVYINPSDFLSYEKIIYMMTGKEKIESGKILIDNLDITQWDMNSLIGKIEYLSHQVNIFKGSIMENITYFDSVRIQDAYNAAGITGFDTLVAQMSEGFETGLDSQSSNYLSAAFLQRLNLTRSLLLRPRIMIFDRVDESMDSETLEIFLWLLRKLKGKLTIIIATENPLIKDMADQIISGR
jgi:ATP-binding cassette subfamily C protein LapB